MTTPRVGFAGLGDLGAALARRLLDTGHDLVVWNRSARRSAPFAADGVAVAATPAALAARCETVVTCLLDADADRAVYLGPDGFVGGGVAGKTFVNTGTIGPEAARALAAEVEARGGWYVDAPSIGDGSSAARGDVRMTVGGSEEAVERARPVLESLGTDVRIAGPAGAAQVLKLCSNLVYAVTLVGLAEVAVAARRFGLDDEVVEHAMRTGNIRGFVVDANLGPMLRGERAPRGTFAVLAKDVDLARDLLAAEGVPGRVAAATSEVMHAGLARGLGGFHVPVAIDAVT